MQLVEQLTCTVLTTAFKLLLV